MYFAFLLVALLCCAVIAYFKRHSLARWIRKPVQYMFHYYYYRDSLTTWSNTSWMGVPLLKLPLDLWIYQEIIYETRPTVIVETGTNKGGSALYFANLLDLLGSGKVISVDVISPPEGAPQHPRIEYLLGSSTDPQILTQIRSRIRKEDRVMVVLDSDHSAAHVRRELELYSPLVSPGCYLVVEDTNVNGHPVFRSHGPGPMEALQDFLAGNQEFSSDLAREKFAITFSPRGWLRRKTAISTANAAPSREVLTQH
jgi:cephalosporin hydroxylase